MLLIDGLTGQLVLGDFEQIEALGIGSGAILGACLLAVYACYSLNTTYCCHQYGVSKTTPFGCREIRYDELESLSFSKTAEYVNHAYVGTRYFFRFDPLPETRGKLILFSISFRKDTDHELDDLFNYMCSVIAGRLAVELEESGQLSLTPTVRLVKDGIEYKEQNSWAHLPFHRIGPIVVDQGIFYLRDNARDFPVAQSPTVYPNFFPALTVLLERLPDSDQTQL